MKNLQRCCNYKKVKAKITKNIFVLKHYTKSQQDLKRKEFHILFIAQAIV